jgi:DNA-binding GntR family transcriptional regulator
MKELHYRNLQQLLKKQIISGSLKEGDILPSENELAETNHITRTTVRHALDELVKEGYIEKRKGKGSVVTGRHNQLGLLWFRGLPVSSDGIDPVKVIFVKKPHLVDWDDYFFFAIPPAEKAAPCIYFKRIKLIGDDPLMLEYTYLPDISLPGLTDKPFINNSLFDTLNTRYLVEIMGVEQEIKAITADKPIAKSLIVKKGKPLIQILQKFQTSRSNLHIYSRLIYNTEKFALSGM